ncbi:MAG: metal-dependent transcriptional regulator [Cyclobacteriaceae bacterium]|nr:metal-dependent transcriptional regulator [Cyclobacteriaceae bacterium HetDA_MAG_MS6]
MASQAEENYLKALLHLSSEKEAINVSALSTLLKVSKPTANSMIKNLKEQGYVHYEKYKPLLLTDAGRKAAALVVRKHRLTEMYLVEKMGFGWEEVHEIAEQVEHVKAPVFFDRMDELLEHPTEDPHGSPIPDKDGNILQRHYMSLSKCQAGDRVRLAALKNSSKDFLEFLDKRGLNLGVSVQVETVEPFDGSVVICYQEKRESLSAQVCNQLMVEYE